MNATGIGHGLYIHFSIHFKMLFMVFISVQITSFSNNIMGVGKSHTSAE